MLKSKLGLTFALIVTLASLILAPVVLAQTAPTDEMYFSETGHGVREPFLKFFVSTGGAARYGYPITNSYTDPATGILIQYFQKARLEWWPGNPDPYKIQLGLLGEQLGKRDPGLAVSAIPDSSNPSCHYFAETGQAVCHLFLTYFKANGDIFQFGYPISAPKTENGRMVQYFQRARLEWWPEKPAGQTVQTAQLGQIYYDHAKLDRIRLQPDAPLAQIAVSVTSLTVTAAIGKPTIAADGSQTVYVTVKDQLGNKVSGASVTMTAAFPDGSRSFTLPPTDVNGTTSFTFAVGKYMPGSTINLTVRADYSGLSGDTRTSYLMWFY
jgi:hypothetical protein